MTFIIIICARCRSWYWCLVCGAAARRENRLFPVFLWEIETAWRDQGPQGQYLNNLCVFLKSKSFYIMFLSVSLFPKAVEDAFVPVIKFKFDGIEVSHKISHTVFIFKCLYCFYSSITKYHSKTPYWLLFADWPAFCQIGLTVHSRQPGPEGRLHPEELGHSMHPKPQRYAAQLGLRLDGFLVLRLY